MFYAVVVNVTRRVPDRTGQQWSSTVSTPTFYLNSDVQGIVDAGHAERIVHGMLEQLVPDAESFSISVEPHHESPVAHLTRPEDPSLLACGAVTTSEINDVDCQDCIREHDEATREED